MATFILFWNPEISSYKLDEYRRFISARPTQYNFNWSVWEYEKAKAGDSFYMVRCKNKPVPGKLNQYGKPLWEPCFDDTTGICMAGHFISDPWEDEDWAGKGRQTFYMDMELHYASDPDKCVLLSTEELMAAIPDFDWKGGHSGRMIDDASSDKIQSMLKNAVIKKRNQIWALPLDE